MLVDKIKCYVIAYIENIDMSFTVTNMMVHLSYIATQTAYSQDTQIHKGILL